VSDSIRVAYAHLEARSGAGLGILGLCLHKTKLDAFEGFCRCLLEFDQEDLFGTQRVIPIRTSLSDRCHYGSNREDDVKSYFSVGPGSLV
jgi:hypothetical protein